MRQFQFAIHLVHWHLVTLLYARLRPCVWLETVGRPCSVQHQHTCRCTSAGKVAFRTRMFKLMAQHASFEWLWRSLGICQEVQYAQRGRCFPWGIPSPNSHSTKPEGGFECFFAVESIAGSGKPSRRLRWLGIACSTGL